MTAEAALPAVPNAVAASQIRVLMVGDVVGKPGLRMVCDAMSWLRRELHADAVVVNAENAADGSGLRCKDYRRLVEHGVDAITLGDHVFRKREIMEALDTESNIVRPANLPAAAPGRGHCAVEVHDGLRIGIVSLLGRVFMKPVDCPFHAADRVLEEMDASVKIRLVDFHAEATSDKQLMGRHLDGRVSAVLGTHTHVATADECVLPGGTGFQCDIGMTGPFDSILGRKIPAVMEATLDGIPLPFQVATGDVRLNGTWVDVDVATGKCTAIGRLSLKHETIVTFNRQAAEACKIL